MHARPARNDALRERDEALERPVAVALGRKARHLQADERFCTSRDLLPESFAGPSLLFLCDGVRKSKTGIRYTERTSQQERAVGGVPRHGGRSLEAAEETLVERPVALAEGDGATRYAQRIGDEWAIEAIHQREVPALSRKPAAPSCVVLGDRAGRRDERQVLDDLDALRVPEERNSRLRPGLRERAQRRGDEERVTDARDVDDEDFMKTHR